MKSSIDICQATASRDLARGASGRAANSESRHAIYVVAQEMAGVTGAATPSANQADQLRE